MRHNKISKISIIAALLAFPFIRPNGINAIFHGSQYIYDFLSIFSLFILAIIFLFKKRKMPINQIFIFLIVFLIILYSTLKYHENIMLHLRITSTCLGIMLSTVVFADHPREYVNAVLFDLEIIIYINALCMIIFPHGMYLSHGTFGSWTNWFMGYDNHWFIFYYAAYFLAIVNILYGGSRIRSFMLIVVLHVTTLYVMSGVLILGLLILDIFYFFKLYNNVFFTYTNVLLFSLGLSVAFVFFMTNPTISFLITKE